MPEEDAGQEQTTDTAVEGGDAQAETWKAMARKHESQSKRLLKENESLRIAAEELKAIKAAGTSAEERIASLESQLASTTAENARLQAKSARLGIAAKAGLLAEDASLIPLGSEEEMTEAAARLSKRLAKKSTDFDGGARGGAPQAPKTLGEVIAAARGARR